MEINYSTICLNDISLRDYQQEAKEKIFTQWNYVNDILYQMPTGTGKTRLFTSIIRDINVWGLRNGKKQRVLIIAHRSELIEQIDRSLNKYHVPHGIIAGGIFKDKRDLTQTVQVASVQTITHSSNFNLASNLQVDFIIIDEAHHAVAASYTRLWRLYPDAKKLGVTATPWRMNNSGFKANFDAFIPSMSIREFMDMGWLAPYKYYSIPLDSVVKRSIDEIKEFDIEGDYKISALENVMDNDHIRAQLLESYKSLAYGKKGIIYSISRAHSEHICAQYRSIGVKIVSIDGETPARKREMLVEEFKNGLIDIIVNVDIFSEGFDCPDIEFIQLARPTKSLVKYIQQVGRGLRKNGDKECLILDNVGMYSHFGLPDADRDWDVYFEGDARGIGYTSNGGHASSGDEGLVTHERDMSEGDEQMVLVQDAAINQVQQPQEENREVDNRNTGLESKEEDDGGDNASPTRRYSIKSKTFAGKYLIEENEDGYFMCNVRNNQQVFLGKFKSYLSGSITIRKINKDTHMIIRVIHRSKGFQDKEMIIGTIKKEGGIMKFSSFDKIITDLRVSI